MGRAIMSDCKRYRYALWRVWDEARACAMFAMLNPSQADERKDDATIRRCVGFADRWGFGSIVVVNMFGLISTKPALLASWPDPIGADNDDVIRALIRPPAKVGAVVCAWGGSVPHALRGRVDDFKALLHVQGVNAQCLGMTLAGEPRHPVRLAYATPLVPYPC